MKFLFGLIGLFLFSTSSDAQVLDKIKSICEQRAIAWAGVVADKNCSYRGNMSIDDVKELGDNKIKVTGYYDLFTTNCEIKRTRFECQMKMILDSMEIQSFCRLADLCVWGTSTGTKWYCYPN